MKKTAIIGCACLLLLTGCGKKEPVVQETTAPITQTTEAPLIDLGGTQVEPEAKNLILEEVPELESLTLPKTTLTLEQIRPLEEICPVGYTLELLGQEVSSDVTELDLSGLTQEDLEEAEAALPMLPNLETVYLMDGEGKSQLTVEDVWNLQQVAKDTLFDYSFELFGLKVSTTDERVEFKNKKIGDDNEPLLRQAMDIMKGCNYMSFEHCRQSDEALAQLREDYRGKIKVAWRIYFAKAGSCLTDRTVLRYVYNVTNSTVSKLKYCEDVEYIDFGHNDTLRDWSWAAYMPNLKAIIVSGSMISDLTPFASCKNLEFLELSNCGYLTDLTPLAQCSSLQRLNISYTKVEDLSPLEDLPNLECLVDVHPKVSREVLDGFAEAHPNCVVSYEGYEYGYPWRYNEDGSPTAYYAKLIEVFHYPDATDTLW